MAILSDVLRETNANKLVWKRSWKEGYTDVLRAVTPSKDGDVIFLLYEKGVVETGHLRGGMKVVLEISTGGNESITIFGNTTLEPLYIHAQSQVKRRESNLENEELL